MPQMIRGGDPAVLKIADNNYLIIYVSAPTTQMMTNVSEKDNGVGLNLGGNDNIQVSPNPAQNHIIVKFTLSQSEHVSLKLFNTLGQEIAQISDETLSAGKHERSFALADWSLESGVYFVQCKTQHSTFKTIPVLITH